MASPLDLISPHLAPASAGVCACPLCSGPMEVRHELPRLWHQPEGSRAYRVAWCSSCDFGRLAPVPGPEELASFYGESYFSSYGGSPGSGRGASSPRSPTGLLDRLRVKLAYWADRGTPLGPGLIGRRAARRPARVCDIGCGNGTLLAALREAGHEVVGVELDEDARRRAAARGVEVHGGRAEELPEAVTCRSFDVVVLSHVLEHCTDPLRSVRNAAALLGAGGRLFVDVPNAGSLIADRSAMSWFHADAGRHINWFTPRSLRAAVVRAGCRFEEHFFSSYTTHFLPVRLSAEQSLWDRLYQGLGPRSPVPRGSRARSWDTLARSALAAPGRKYEFVGAIGVRP